jgi:predicted metalloprotease with PDZ domain
MIRRPLSWRTLGLVGVVWLWSSVLFSQEPVSAGVASPAIRYTVSLAAYRDHLLRVQLQLPPGDASTRVQLPVWNALYQVRDFSQYVNWVQAKSDAGQPLPIQKLDKTTWQIDGAKDGATVAYEILADNSGPYGAQLNDHHAFFNLAEVLMYSVPGRALPVQLRFREVPPNWKFATALAGSGDGFEAENYDRLVDAPVEIGILQESDFDEGGGHYRVVVDADPADYDMETIVADVHKIVVAATTWMQDRPFASYLFLYHFPRTGGGGGMEHACSTAIDLNAHEIKDSLLPLDDVTAHEFFHLWNVKRIRPQSLEPVDYSRENYTRALWFSEGVTSTVEDIILLRAGLLDERRYLQRLGEQISELEDRPGHRAQSAEESSLDAWLEKYPYYRQPQRSISYYNKGEMLGVALDLAIRDASHGSASLRDVFVWMNQHFARQGKFFPDSAGVRQAAEAVGPGDLSGFFQNYVAGVQEIPWNDFFGTVGLQVVGRTSTVADAGFIEARNFDAPPVVVSLQPGSTAERAGLAVGDVILEINGQVAPSDFEAKLQELHPGDTIRMRVRQRRAEHELQWKMGSREEVEFQVRDVENSTAQQKARRGAWLRGESQSAGDARP